MAEVQSSESILNDLFTAINEVESSEDEEGDSEGEEEAEDDDVDNEEEGEGESERKQRKRKKSHKHHKKHKKKKKRHKHKKKREEEEEEEEREETRKVRRIDERKRSKESHFRERSPSPSPPPHRVRQQPRPRSPPRSHGYHAGREHFVEDSSRGNERRRREEWWEGRERERMDYGERMVDRRRRRRREYSPRRQETRPPVRKDEDTFWESTWDAMQVQKKADAQERKGKHFLEGSRNDRTPTLSPSPKRRRARSPTPECEELQRLRKLKEIQELVVKDGEKYVAEPLDPNLFEWDNRLKMWKRKKDGVDNDDNEALQDNDYNRLLKKRMEEQFLEKRKAAETGSSAGEPSRGDGPKGKEEEEEDDPKENEEKKLDASKLTLDEIEEIRRKREKYKKKKEEEEKREKEEGEIREDEGRRGRSEDKEDGEVQSDEEREGRGGERGRHSRHRRSRSRSRDRGRKGERDARHHSRRRSPYSSRRSRHSPPQSSYYGSGRRGFRGRSRSPEYPDYRRRRFRGRSWSRSRSRSRERNDSKDGGFRGSRSAVDKEKLLAIARKNAVKLLNSNNLMGMDHDRLVAIKSGGQSLRQLTEFCKELAKKGLTDDLSDEEAELVHGAAGKASGDEEERGFHHPFMVKDRPVPGPFPLGLGTSMAPSGVGLEMLTPAMKTAAKSHRMLEFPVSSGNAHRIKESEVNEKVGAAEEESPKKTEIKEEDEEENVGEMVPRKFEEESKTKVSKKEDEPKEIVEPLKEAKEEGEVLTEAELLNKQNPLGVLMFGGHKEPPLELTMETVPEKEEEEEKSKALVPVSVPAPTGAVVTPSSSSSTPPPSSSSASSKRVFEDVEQPTVDIGTIVSQRLSAMKKLSDNPNDPEALQTMYEAQKQMSAWAASKNKPGQFTGHTGAKVLSKGELSTGVQAWARQDQFTQAKKVSGGFGEFMLKKMGWNQGEGLGKDRSGDVDPLTLDIKMDKKGLMAAEEFLIRSKKMKGGVLTLTGCKDLSGKHPVSALMELATKRHWGPPNFTQAFECGPSHKKQYIFKVTVNGVDYQPTIACDNKKKAKADAATVALMELGLLPKDPNNPL